MQTKKKLRRMQKITERIRRQELRFMLRPSRSLKEILKNMRPRNKSSKLKKRQRTPSNKPRNSSMLKSYKKRVMSQLMFQSFLQLLL